jgi:hypothetical protein
MLIYINTYIQIYRLRTYMIYIYGYMRIYVYSCMHTYSSDSRGVGEKGTHTHEEEVMLLLPALIRILSHRCVYVCICVSGCECERGREKYTHTHTHTHTQIYTKTHTHIYTNEHAARATWMPSSTPPPPPPPARDTSVANARAKKRMQV